MRGCRIAGNFSTRSYARFDCNFLAFDLSQLINLFFLVTFSVMILFIPNIIELIIQGVGLEIGDIIFDFLLKGPKICNLPFTPISLLELPSKCCIDLLGSVHPGLYIVER